MKVLKHPLHLVLIHFPSALLPMDFVCYAVYYFTKDDTFAFSAFYAMAGAVVTGWLSIVTGALDMIKIGPDKAYLIQKALLHGGINTTVIIIYSVLAYSSYKVYPQLHMPALTILMLKAALICFMIVANYLGANLILKHKVGIEE